MRRTGHRVAVFAMAVGLVVVSATAAWAHEDEESTEAGVLVRQAIALIVNAPANKMAIEDKIDDALKSTKPEGVELDLVRQAANELDGGSLHRVRALLEVSVGAQPHVSGMVVRPILETAEPPTGAAAEQAVKLATGEETGTNVAIDPLDPRRTMDAGTWLALAAVALVAAAGVALSVRFRPPVPLRQLKSKGDA